MKIINVLLLTTAIILLPSAIFSAEFSSKSKKNININKNYDDDFKKLTKNYEKFVKSICAFPTKDNTIITIVERDKNKKEKIVLHAKKTYPVIDDRVIQTCNEFISFKKNNGTSLEKSLYKKISIDEFLIRLLEKRPLVFMTKHDDTRLRYAKAPYDSIDLTTVGTDRQKKPLILEEYISYDEVQLAALIGVSSPTFFINNGNRKNEGILDTSGAFETEGIYIGLVGARFERQNLMEWQHIIITQEQNKLEKGYGLDQCNNGLLKIWSDLYGCKFPTYQEAVMDTSGNYVQHEDKFFNVQAYKKRIELVINPFLIDANQRAEGAKKQAYVHVVGLGLGIWEFLPNNQQRKYMLEVYKNIIQNNNLAYIADIDFSWFGDDAETLVTDMSNNSVCFDAKKHPITIHFSQRNPADKLQGPNEGKLLVACYAWDGNAYPGNEYWVGALGASGDPAAACCSTIATMQNILINPWLNKNINDIYKPIKINSSKK